MSTTPLEVPEELRARYPRLLAVELDGVLLAFRPLTFVEADQLIEAQRRGTSMQVMLDAVLPCCVYGMEHLPQLVESYPLTFGDDTAKELLDMARADARMTIQGAKTAWQNGQKNLGFTAESLLAFKSYTGGAWTKEQFAGALHIADLIDTHKGLFRLVLAFLKSMGRRR